MIGSVSYVRMNVRVIVHVLWECPLYDGIRNTFMVE